MFFVKLEKKNNNKKKNNLKIYINLFFKTEMSFWSKFDRILTKVEKKGFDVANKGHIWGVNILIMSLCYGVYSMFRDYNDFFIDARVITVLKKDSKFPNINNKLKKYKNIVYKA